MTANAGSNAVDSGVILPNVNDGFGGSAPDLGAYELGQIPPPCGPRSAITAPTNLRIIRSSGQ